MASFDRVADIYDATRSLRPDVMARAVEALLSHVRGSSVADFGVGTGRFAAPLAAAGVKVVGVDLADAMIRQALTKGSGDLVLADAGKVPFRDLSFDYVLAVHFLHLVRDWREAVAEMARVGRRGLLTLMEEQRGARPRDLYLEVRERLGYPVAGLKLGEREIMKLAAPGLTELAAEYQEVFDPEELLAEYSARQHSVTWDVPEEVNARIVGEMRERLGGRRTLTRTLTLVGWSRGQLLALHPSA